LQICRSQSIDRCGFALQHDLPVAVGADGRVLQREDARLCADVLKRFNVICPTGAPAESLSSPS
jgi:hypothetical protein